MNTIDSSEPYMSECILRLLRQNLEFFRWTFYSLTFVAMGCLKLVLEPNSTQAIGIALFSYFLGFGCISYSLKLNAFWYEENMKWVADNYKEGSE